MTEQELKDMAEIITKGERIVEELHRSQQSESSLQNMVRDIRIEISGSRGDGIRICTYYRITPEEWENYRTVFLEMLAKGREKPERELRELSILPPTEVSTPTTEEIKQSLEDLTRIRTGSINPFYHPTNPNSDTER